MVEQGGHVGSVRPGADMLRRMAGAGLAEVRRLGEGAWGLGRARAVAREVEGSKAAVKALVAVLFEDDVEGRKRAADVARRVTERSSAPLEAYADELAGVLAQVDPEERRTRWHLGLVVARVAHRAEQRLRAGRLMEVLAEDESNVVRCSGIEGLGLVACQESSLRGIAEEVAARALMSGTKAERCRARESLKRMERGAVSRRRVL